MRTAIALLFSCLVASATLLAFTRIFSWEPTAARLERDSTPKMDPPLVDCSYYRDDTGDVTYWVAYASGPGVTVFGFPSRGGAYVLRHCLGVELDFLGLDRFNHTPRPSKSDPDWQAKEDAHCDRMRRLGATWWRSLAELYEKDIIGSDDETESFIQVGWPASGGVWVLHITVEKAGDIGAARIQNAYSMEERCNAIEQLGGIFYADPKDCPHLDLP